MGLEVICRIIKTLVKRLFLVMMVLQLLSCSQKQQGDVRSMYYWSTTLNVTPRQQKFLRQHHVSRLYVRYFDVVLDDHGEVQPNATLSFTSPMPDSVEVVPTVFILNACMRGAVGDLADKLLRRILQMNETHDVGTVREIQVDCDWTGRTQEHYFAFLRQLRDLARKRDITISATIRLHQLSMSPPPVDHGTLMLYNTGDVTDINVVNPILDADDVAPYLRYLKDYSLSLNAAYPIFTWQVLFRGNRFVGILHAGDELPVMSGDSIVTHAPHLDEILRVRKAVEARRPDIHQEIILFDLSDKNINRFKTNDYEKIFSD